MSDSEIDFDAETRLQELRDIDRCYDPESVFPFPLLPGASVYRDPKIWSPDWRDRLPEEDHELKIEDPITRDSEAYQSVMRTMEILSKQIYADG